MKTSFQKEFEQLRSCSHVPNQYYGHLLNLAGMVYDYETDKDIEEDLKFLSITYDSISNSTLGKIKEIVHEIVFWTKQERNNRLPDIEHLLREHRNATLAEINTFVSNLTQLYGANEGQNNQANDNVKIVADFTKLLDKLQTLINEVKPEKVYKFNIAKIVGFITSKGIEKGYLTIMETDE
jgi:hypothetical protein